MADTVKEVHPFVRVWRVYCGSPPRLQGFASGSVFGAGFTVLSLSLVWGGLVAVLGGALMLCAVAALIVGWAGGRRGDGVGDESS